MTQRRGYSEWRKLIEEFEKSGSSREDLAAMPVVKPSALQFWFYKLRKQASRAPRSHLPALGGCPVNAEPLPISPHPVASLSWAVINTAGSAQHFPTCFGFLGV